MPSAAASGGASPTSCATWREFGTRYVCVTGGEPLAQKDCHALLTALCDAGYRVSLETSGALRWQAVDPRVVRVVDVKTPDSGEERRNLLRPARHAAAAGPDQVRDLQPRRLRVEPRAPRASLRSRARSGVLFSPSHGQVAARQLADWILADRLPVRFQVQLHKILWGEERAR